jgi:hypothetical protein
MINNNNNNFNDEMTVVTGNITVHPTVQCVWKNSTIKMSIQSQEAMPASEMAIKAITIPDDMQKTFQQDIKTYDNRNNELRDYTLQDTAKFATMYHVTCAKGNSKKRQKHLTWIVFRFGT